MSKSSQYLDTKFLLPHGYHFNEKILRNLKNSLVKVKFECKVFNNQYNLACQVIDRKHQTKDDSYVDILKEINHTNIVNIHSIFQRNQLIFIFIEWIDGMNVQTYIIQNGNFEENHAKFLFRQILLGLKYLHDKKIAHCNLTCSSILIHKDSVKIACFKYIQDCKINPIHSVGSKCPLAIQYRAPEIIQNMQHDPIAADVYSTGIILFIMLNALFPYSSSDIKELINNQKYCEYHIRASKIHTLSISCQVAIRILLEPDPILRWNCDKILNLDWLKEKQ